jgi:hypothetical protein
MSSWRAKFTPPVTSIDRLLRELFKPVESSKNSKGEIRLLCHFLQVQDHVNEVMTNFSGSLLTWLLDYFQRNNAFSYLQITAV